MANRLFNQAQEDCLNAGNELDTNDIRVMLVLSTYVFDATDDFLADLGAVDNGRSAALAGKSITNGVFDATDTSLVATAASACNALIIFTHTGADATAKLIGYIDTATGLPFTPAASQTVNITWDNGTNRIFKIGT